MELFLLAVMLVVVGSVLLGFGLLKRERVRRDVERSQPVRVTLVDRVDRESFLSGEGGRRHVTYYWIVRREGTDKQEKVEVPESLSRELTLGSATTLYTYPNTDRLVHPEKLGRRVDWLIQAGAFPLAVGVAGVIWATWGGG